MGLRDVRKTPLAFDYLGNLNDLIMALKVSVHGIPKQLDFKLISKQYETLDNLQLSVCLV